MNILDRLKRDHRSQESLLELLAETSGDSNQRRQLFERLSREATAHANAEEQTLYAALLEHSETQEQARHSIAEHQSADELIHELEELGTGSGGWLAKFEVLKRELEHHIKEEENEVFALATEVLADKDLAGLGEEFDQRKRAELDELDRPSGVTRNASAQG